MLILLQPPPDFSVPTEKMWVKTTWFLVPLIFALDIHCLEIQNKNMDTRIVGGTEVDIRLCPYQVSIQFFNQHFCGGALITPSTVLTAAHCFGVSSSSMSALYEVKVGSNSTSGDAVKIKSVLVHPNYNPSTIDSDIALVHLHSNVTLSDKVKLIRISQRDNYVAGTLARVSGWGYQQENGTVSTLLRKAEIPITSRTQCMIYYKNVVEITRNMICAGYVEGGKDACQGDSGGPLVLGNNLIGIVSFGMGCARASYPGVYTNVAALLDWVVENSNYVKSYCDNFSANAALLILSVIPVLLYLY